MNYKVLCCGSRDWDDTETILEALLSLIRNHSPEQFTIIHGDCRGADRLCGFAASELGMHVKAYPANWETHGKKAGPLRNRKMLEEGKPDIVFAFHDDVDNSKGTKHMVEISIESDIPVQFFTSRIKLPS